MTNSNQSHPDVVLGREHAEELLHQIAADPSKRISDMYQAVEAAEADARLCVEDGRLAPDEDSVSRYTSSYAYTLRRALGFSHVTSGHHEAG